MITFIMCGRNCADPHRRNICGAHGVHHVKYRLNGVGMDERREKGAASTECDVGYNNNSVDKIRFQFR